MKNYLLEYLQSKRNIKADGLDFTLSRGIYLAIDRANEEEMLVIAWMGASNEGTNMIIETITKRLKSQDLKTLEDVASYFMLIIQGFGKAETPKISSKNTIYN